MSSESLLFGHIEGVSEYYFSSHYNESNTIVLSSLSEEDTWPELTRDLFSVPAATHFYRTQIIAFGTSYKNIEHAWGLWLSKFEQVISKLYWLSVNLTLDSEMFGKNEYHWYCKDADRYSIKDMPIPFPSTHWGFDGGPRNFD